MVLHGGIEPPSRVYETRALAVKRMKDKNYFCLTARIAPGAIQVCLFK